MQKNKTKKKNPEAIQNDALFPYLRKYCNTRKKKTKTWYTVIFTFWKWNNKPLQCLGQLDLSYLISLVRKNQVIMNILPAVCFICSWLSHWCIQFMVFIYVKIIKYIFFHFVNNFLKRNTILNYKLIHLLSIYHIFSFV